MEVSSYTIQKKISILFQWIIDAIFPKFCLKCGREGVWVCSVCGETLQSYKVVGCLICKKGSETNICRDCAIDAPVSFLFSACSYTDPLIKKIVRALKYEYVTELGEIMGGMLARRMNDCKYACVSDACVVPIPIHIKKFRDRGFNQSDLIARGYAKEINMSYVSDALIRTVHTKSQVELLRAERIQNITGAFAVRDASRICGKVVYLIDDVYTTGATLLEAARTLRSAGVQDVIGVTFAREE